MDNSGKAPSWEGRCHYRGCPPADARSVGGQIPPETTYRRRHGESRRGWVTRPRWISRIGEKSKGADSDVAGDGRSGESKILRGIVYRILHCSLRREDGADATVEVQAHGLIARSHRWRC